MKIPQNLRPGLILQSQVQIWCQFNTTTTNGSSPKSLQGIHAERSPFISPQLWRASKSNPAANFPKTLTHIILSYHISWFPNNKNLKKTTHYFSKRVQKQQRFVFAQALGIVTRYQYQLVGQQLKKIDIPDKFYLTRVQFVKQQTILIFVLFWCRWCRDYYRVMTKLAAFQQAALESTLLSHAHKSEYPEKKNPPRDIINIQDMHNRENEQSYGIIRLFCGAIISSCGSVCAWSSGLDRLLPKF